MSSGTITYQSSSYIVYESKSVFETKTNKGITCTWTGEATDYYTSIKNWWNFNWDELKKEGIDELSGYIIVKRRKYTESAQFDVVLTSADQVVEGIMSVARGSGPVIHFEYSLTPKRTFQVIGLPYEMMFMATERTDAILVVDGKKLHVNKEFLSFHSDFFRALFTSNFEEKNMDEIPIGDVTYEDFARLLSMVYPQNSFPSDNNVEKLLELADRFIMPSVTRSVENHLLNISKLSNEKMMWLADKYSMPTLLKKTIRGIDSVEKAKKIRGSPGYKDLSDKTAVALFNRVMQFV